jgi:hypothetical protein
MINERSVEVTNKVALKNRQGDQVAFDGTNHYNASALFSDTVDLPTPGYIYIGAAGTLNLMLIGSTVALTYTVTAPTILPLVVKRIMATSSDSITAYIIM